MSDRIADLMREGFDKILPIPKTPRVYHAPPPPKPTSWIPRGNIKTATYRRTLESFATIMKKLDSNRGKKLPKISGRGWGYVLEGLGKIEKGDFKACSKAINDCRKLGYLPIDFIAQDQDPTRRFAELHEAICPASTLINLKTTIEESIEALPHLTTDYWEGEKYYLMMCVEKIDIFNLFRPICKEYNVPIVNSKGWYPIMLRYYIAQLSIEAEKQGLQPVLLLFYDHDLIGIKITQKFRKGLRDLKGATKWDPSTLIIDRFGLNKEDIEKHGLTWIQNLKSSSGKNPDWNRKDVREYVQKYGRRKCEANALIRNEETIEIGERMCRRAIEKYYGEDALERFEKKKEASKEKLKEVYDNPIWKQFGESLDKLIEDYAEEPEEISEEELEEEEYEVFIDNKYYGRCPQCHRQFNYDETCIDKLVRCRWCKTPLRLRKADNWKT